MIKATVLLAVMVPVCISDWRRREVSDAYWWVLGAFGISCMLVTPSSLRWEHVMMIIGTAMVLISILHDVPHGRYGEFSYHAVAAVLFIIPMVSAWNDPIVRQFTAVPVMFLIFLAMFHLGVVKGGADAKFLIVLTMIFQTYPEFGMFPMIAVPSISMIFQFSLAVLFHAALFSVFASIYYVALNIRNGDIRVPSMLIGYRMDVNTAKMSHVWPLEKVAEGGTEITNRAQDPETLDQFDGITDRIWVTPMIPFMIPMTFAAVFVIFIGNLLFLPF